MVVLLDDDRAAPSAPCSAMWPRDQKSCHQSAVSRASAAKPFAAAASSWRSAAAATSSFGSKVAALAIRMVNAPAPALAVRRTSVSLAMRGLRRAAGDADRDRGFAAVRALAEILREDDAVAVESTAAKRRV